MISVPIAVNTKVYYHQLSIFWDNHKRVYGEEATNKTHAVIVLQEPNNEKWDIGIPHSVVNSWTNFIQKPNDIHLAPINIQIGLSQVIEKFKDSDVIELLDCDMFHLQEAPILQPEENQFFVDDTYESWHLFSNSKNKNIVSNHLEMNKNYIGGFVPIIGTAKTFKKVLNDWINIHIKIYEENPNKLIRWWSGMFSFQVACANNNIKMIAKNNCYFPTINNILENHYIAHYCCDEVYFDKKIVLLNPKNFDTSKFPNNTFYNEIKKYIKKISQA